jgi:hypothetical protein
MFSKINMSLLHNTNRAIFLSLDTTAQASAFISVQFPVKEIVCRQIVFATNDATANVQGLNAFGVLYSELVQNNVLGNVSLFSNTENALQNIRYAFRTPQSISGTYRFQLRDLTGAACSTLTTSGKSYNLVVMLEFIEYQAPVTDVVA